ncbi:MAG: DUF4163 domain-containing protein, partial [Muribaculaceae bacterium]|nr:DUF4163 domain-containing protein [Muribaculaceae bacterium]
MNKVGYMAVAAAICFTGMLTGCGNGINNEVVTPLMTETVDYADSLALGGCRASSSAKVDFPESGDSTLVNNLRAWIAGRLVPYNGMTSADNTMLHGMDTVTNGESLVKTACRIALDMAEADFVQFVEDSISTTYEYDYSVAKVYETTTFVSYTSQTYVYSGGAHGGIIASGVVFARADGEQYGWNNIFLGASLDAVRGRIE